MSLCVIAAGFVKDGLKEIFLGFLCKVVLITNNQPLCFSISIISMPLIWGKSIENKNCSN